MLIRKGFRYRIYPTRVQAARLISWEHTLRWLWNLALEQRHLCLARATPRYLTAFDQINELTALRAEAPWLVDVPRNVCAQLLVGLDLAWQRCFKRLARQPRWKRKGRDVLAITEPHPKVWRLDGSSLVFPKVGALRAVIHRAPEGTAKSCTVSRDGDQWFASILCELEIPDPVWKPGAVGLDRGVVNLVADSNGRLTSNPQHLKRSLSMLARAQRAVSRRQKGSRNRERAKAKVARLHRRIRRQRDHVLHCVSKTYAESQGTVVVERLQVRNMVQASRGLARSILDAGWGRLVEMLRYKLYWNGGWLIEVAAAYSSQTCAACGHVATGNRPTQADFACIGCGVCEHADINAAKVILQRGLAVEPTVTGCGGFAAVRRPAKQQLRVVRRGTRHVGSGSSKAPAFRPG